MANVKITELTALTDPASSDVLPIVDVASDQTKKVTIADLLENAGAGSAGAAAFAFDGDADTGMYRTGANALGFTTGGAGRLFIDSSGNIGINGAATASSSVKTLQITDSTTARVLFESTGTGGRKYGWYTSVDGQFAAYDYTANSERFRITSAGRCGLGTTDPATKLHISDSAAPEFRIVDTTNNCTGFMRPVDSSVRFGTGSNHPLEFHVNSSQKAVITSAGNLGINDSSPANTLSVLGASTAGTSSTGNVAEFAGPSNTNGFQVFVNDTNNNTGIQTKSADAFLLNPHGGNVGIGNTAPGAKLQIEGTSDQLKLTYTSIASYIHEVHSNGDYSIAKDSSEFLRLDSSGRLLVGASSARTNFFNTTTVTAGIQAEGTTGEGSIIAAIRNINDATSVPVFLLAKSRGTTDGSNTIVQANDHLGYLSFQGSDGGQFVEAAQIKAEVDGTPGSNDMPGRIVLSTTADGASSPTERLRITNDGKIGIGDTDPDALLVIKGDSDAATTPSIRLKDGTDTREAWITNASGDLSLNVGGDDNVAHGTFKMFESGILDFAQASGSRLRVTDTGAVGIGQTSPSGRLEVNGGYLTVRSGASSYPDGVSAPIIYGSTGGGSGTFDQTGNLVLQTRSDAGNYSICMVTGDTPTERLRISSSGRPSFYTDSDGLTIGNAAAAGTSNRFIQGGHGATAVNTGTTSFIVYTNGNVVNSNNSYGSISDVKLKENIVDASSQWDDIKDLRVRNYNFIEGQTHTQIGVVAQEVETVSPGLVTESPDTDEEGNDLGTTTKSVNYSVLYMKAVKALQEAMDRIETLETSNADLLARVSALEAS